MLIGSVFITVAGIYLLYRGYIVGVKKEISTRDNPQLPSDNIKDPEGYCKFLSTVFNVLGFFTFVAGVICFLDDAKFIKLGNYVYVVFGIVLALVIICSIILSKYLKKFY